jgi:CRISPR/Cas system-associated exonuclease Cas4 (RecB family)
VTLPLVLLLLGLALLLAAAWLRRRSRLPAGAILTADTGAEPGRLLRSPRHRLYGRPDYLIRRGRRVVPVELKPSHRQPYDSAIMQLMAYCLLVEETYGRPDHGLLVLRDRAVPIAYTDERRAALLDLLAAVRAAPPVPPRSHDQPGRCRACAFAPVCTEALDSRVDMT